MMFGLRAGDPDLDGGNGRSGACTPAARDHAAMPAAALLRLLTWLSPSFPVGAYSYSHGLEWAVETGDIRDAESLQDWIAGLLAFGSARADAILAAAAHRAAAEGNEGALGEAAELAVALAASKERRLETLAQGEAFALAVKAAWPAPGLALLDGLRAIGVAYPVAVGVAGAAHGIEARDLLPAFLHATTANLVSAGVRLIPLGQNAGLAVLARLEACIAGTARWAATAELDDIGNAAFRSEIAAMRHETQYTRLFRS